MRVYIAVTADEYELPIDIDTSPSELAKRMGVNPFYVFSSIHKGKNGKSRTIHRKMRFYRIELEDEDEQSILE